VNFKADRAQWIGWVYGIILQNGVISTNFQKILVAVLSRYELVGKSNKLWLITFSRVFNRSLIFLPVAPPGRKTAPHSVFPKKQVEI
jgi:hypothetical protein